MIPHSFSEKAICLSCGMSEGFARHTRIGCNEPGVAPMPWNPDVPSADELARVARYLHGCGVESPARIRTCSYCGGNTSSRSCESCGGN